MWNEDKLNELLTVPSDALCEDMAKINGDIIVLGATGKMGPSLCLLARNAIEKAGLSKKVIAVSRFSDPIAAKLLRDEGIDTISCDMLELSQLRLLPDVPNVIFMAGRKFGTSGNEYLTWAMNATLPAYVAEKYKNSRIVAFSSGNVYPIVPLSTGGCTEESPTGAIGEYTQSVLARERVFEYASAKYGTKVLLFRLNFAVDLRYGVLYDMANKILTGEPISLRTPCLNCIWQGSANEMAIRSLLHAGAPAVKLNVTGSETISIKTAATRLGRYLGREPIFEGEPGNDAYLNDASLAMELFGYPSVPIHKLIRWQAEYILDGGRTLDKPTHFEERKGSY
ncbi:MAG: NAD(P)-dependent oxidoreductase [Clostridiales bacterium]|nr:NAD(P)-dependent oxidoreductase [Clostridiales bacterium]